MQKTLSLLALVCLLCGCAGPRKFVSSGFKRVRLAVTLHEGKVILANRTGLTIHNAKLDIGTFTWGSDFWYRDNISVGNWPDETGVSVEFNVSGIQKVDVTGWCDEGRIKGYWTASR